MANMKKIFATWQKLAGVEGDPWESDEDAQFLFDFMPHTGKGLEKICQGHPHGEEVLERLQRFFRDAAEPSQDEEGETNFSQTKLPRKDDAQIRALILQHAANLRQMAVQAAADPNQDEIVKSVGNPPKLKRVDSPDDIEEDFDINSALRVDLPSAFDDNVAQANASKNPLWYLKEALYHSAWNHYAVPDYVLWPVHKGKSTLEDPYLPGYELWLQNVAFAYTANAKIAYAVDEE